VDREIKYLRALDEEVSPNTALKPSAYAFGKQGEKASATIKSRG
jgi:hypothetical protein